MIRASFEFEVLEMIAMVEALADRMIRPGVENTLPISVELEIVFTVALAITILIATVAIEIASIDIIAGTFEVSSSIVKILVEHSYLFALL